MQQWALIVADTLLIAIGLAGGALTLARGGRLGRARTALAVTSCAALLAAATTDLILWFEIFPDRVANDNPGEIQNLANTAVLTTNVLICVSYGLLIAAVHVAPRASASAPGRSRPLPTTGTGWSPPRQIQAADWRSTSGVWSIPRRTFDQPHDPSRS